MREREKVTVSMKVERQRRGIDNKSRSRKSVREENGKEIAKESAGGEREKSERENAPE